MWLILALALLGGVAVRIQVLAGDAALNGGAEITVVSGPQTRSDSSMGDHVFKDSSTSPSATLSGDHRMSTESGTASEATTRFLMYDATSGSFGYADETGAMVIEPRFQRAGQFVKGLAPVQFQSDSGGPEYGYIDTAGSVVIGPRFKTAFAFSEGLARVEVAVKGLYRFGFIDRSGTIVIEPQYVAAWDFSQGLSRVELSDASGRARYGFIDRNGTLVIDPLFEAARDFAEGLAAVAIDGKWGYIDRTGNWVIEPRFPYAQSFVASGLAAVDLEAPGTALGEEAPADEDARLHQAFIDKTGGLVWERQKEQSDGG